MFQMSQHKPTLSLLFAASLAVLLGGCGGGGGGGNSNPGPGSPSLNDSVSGKVVDTSGNPVPSAIVFVDGVAENANGVTTATASYQEGGYEVNDLASGFHVVSVSTVVNGITYTGATDIGIPSGSQVAVTNANIIVSPTNEQAPVYGYVKDASGNPIAGARVSFQTAFTAAGVSGSSAPASTAAIVAITDSTGYYQLGGGNILNTAITEPGLPVQQTVNGVTSARSYTITASALPVGSTVYTNGTPVTTTLTAATGTTLPTQDGFNFTLPVQAGTTTTGATPTINYLLAFTQPDIQPYSAQTETLSVATAAYEQVRQALAPKYKQLETGERAAAQIKHLRTATAHAVSANQYTIEMNLFFSLPGDTATSPSSVRNELSGFEILNNAQENYSPSSSLANYDYLEDPLANYYVDPDLGLGASNFFYNVDDTYQFAVQSIATNGTTNLGQSSTQSVEPLSLVNLSQPADPNDTNVIETLATDPTFTWTTVDANNPTVPNNRVGSYYVYIYNSFPGATTTPVYQSGPISPTSSITQSFTPSGLSLAASEYWVIIAAEADDNTAASEAISVSQITPFNVP